MEYQTNLNTYRLHFRAEAVVAAENEAAAVDSLKDRTVSECDDFILTYTFASD